MGNCLGTNCGGTRNKDILQFGGATVGGEDGVAAGCTNVAAIPAALLIQKHVAIHEFGKFSTIIIKFISVIIIKTCFLATMWKKYINPNNFPKPIKLFFSDNFKFY